MVSVFTGKRILLGITGGIAAYKSAHLLRLLQAQGADVRVVMTKNAQSFITALTMQALSGHPVYTELLDADTEAAMGHIALARWADLLVISPASANMCAQIAAGRADDLLSTLCLAYDGALCLAPAMNQAMWRDAATQDNITHLKQRGVLIMGPDEGEQACGDVGPGRMLEPEAIVSSLQHHFARDRLAGWRMVITAGPTREAIDPVRYLSNHSSGKMGYALAQAARELGADVHLISGPTQLSPPAGVKLTLVETALQMHATVMQQMAACDVFIGCAAVADYRPATVAAHKIKKTNADMRLELVANPDIISDVAKHDPRPLVVGFAAETEDMLQHARDKLAAKNLDYIVANDVGGSSSAFANDYNTVTVISRDAELQLPNASKYRIAQQLMEYIRQQQDERHE